MNKVLKLLIYFSSLAARLSVEQSNAIYAAQVTELSNRLDSMHNANIESSVVSTGINSPVTSNINSPEESPKSFPQSSHTSIYSQISDAVPDPSDTQIKSTIPTSTYFQISDANLNASYNASKYQGSSLSEWEKHKISDNSNVRNIESGFKGKMLLY